MNFWTRVRLFFSAAGSLAARALHVAQEVLPELVAAGCADPSLSDVQRRAKVRHELAVIVAERYPNVPAGLLDVAFGIALDLLRAQIAKR